MKQSLRLLPVLALCLYASLSASEQSLALFEKTTQAVIQQEAQRLTKVLEHGDTQHWYWHILPVFQKLEEVVKKEPVLTQLIEESKKNSDLYSKLFLHLQKSILPIDEQLKLIPNVDKDGTTNESRVYIYSDAVEAYGTFKEQGDQKELPLLGQMAHDHILFRDVQKLIVKSLQNRYDTIVAPLQKQIKESAPSLVLCASYLRYENPSKKTTLLNAMSNSIMERAMGTISYALIEEDLAGIPPSIEMLLKEHRDVYYKAMFAKFLQENDPLLKKFHSSINETIRLLTTGAHVDRLKTLGSYVTRDISDISIPTEGKLAEEEAKEESTAAERLLANTLISQSKTSEILDFIKAADYFFLKYINKPESLKQRTTQVIDGIICIITAKPSSPNKKDHRTFREGLDAIGLAYSYLEARLNNFGPLLKKLHAFAPIKTEQGKATFHSEDLDYIFEATRIIDLMTNSCDKTLKDCSEKKVSIEDGIKSLSGKLKTCTTIANRHLGICYRCFIPQRLLEISQKTETCLKKLSTQFDAEKAVVLSEQ